jgi:hypothetical protein
LLLKTGKHTEAHSALAVAGEGILTSEAHAAGADVVLDARVDLCVALEVVLANEALAAVVALELAIAKVSLHVSANVLLPAEALVALGEHAGPFVVLGVLF